MAVLGEIRKGREIGYKGGASFIWHACEKCGKERWVRIQKGKPIDTLCFSCGKEPQRRTKQKGGYITIRLRPDNPFFSMTSTSGSMLEHRYIMAQKLGRPLQKWEIVHHKNGKGGDNRPENLELVSHYENLSADLILANQKELLKEIRILRLQVKNLQEQLQGGLYAAV